MNNLIDENKMDFIICYNDALYMRECQRYIENLCVPEDMYIEVLGVLDADSMCAGYQAAMQQSNAKYKVYLHQDTFILNKNFIVDVVKLFQEHKDYGMLGVVGSTEMRASARYWDAWNVGNTWVNTSLGSGIAFGNETMEQMNEVIAIDGMIMITQYDVDWREDIFSGFDFYDISQCVEFALAGYKIGVPYQDTPWCMHDCGHSKFDNYEINRKKFCDTYQTMGYVYEPDLEMISRSAIKKQMDTRMVEVEAAFERNDYAQAVSLVQAALNQSVYHTVCCNYLVILEILLEEIKAHNLIFSFSKSNLPKDILFGYQKLRFLIMRLEFGLAIDDLKDVCDWAKHPEHLPEMEVVIRHTALQAEEVYQLLQDLNGINHVTAT